MFVKNRKMSKHWGEILVVSDTESGIAALEREQITKPRSMDLEGPPLHQPSSIEYPASARLPSEQTQVDGFTSHTILLQQYCRKIKNMLQVAHHQIENQQKTGESEAPIQLTPAPQLPELPLKHAPENPLNPLQYIAKDTERKFVCGVGKLPPELNEHTARQMLRMSVAVLAAHIGYETSTESVLETMVDVVHEFYLHLTHLLRAAVDKQLLTRSCPFPDVLEQVFHEVGLGSVTSLHSFYQQRVVQHHAHLLRRCQLLRDEYERLRCPDKRLADPTSPSQGVLDADRQVKEESVGTPTGTILFPVSEETDELVDQSDTLLHHLDDLQGFEPETASSSALHEEDMSTLACKGDGTTREPTPNLDPDEDMMSMPVSSNSPLNASTEYMANLDAISPPAHIFQRPVKRPRK